MEIDRINYWISEVCIKDNHIHSVRIYRDSELAYGLDQTWTVKQVIDTINKGYNINTIVNVNGRWQSGARVKVVTIGGSSFITTDRDESASDNLENLPKFS